MSDGLAAERRCPPRSPPKPARAADASPMPTQQPERGADEADEARPRASPTVSTWRRPAPTARSRASSRVRCCTMIEKVLVITKIPTSRAMPAKTWMMIVKNEKPACTSDDSSVGRLLAGEGLDVVGERVADARSPAPPG